MCVCVRVYVVCHRRLEVRKIIFARDVKLETVSSRRRLRNGGGTDESASSNPKISKNPTEIIGKSVAELLYENIAASLLKLTFRMSRRPSGSLSQIILRLHCVTYAKKIKKIHG